MNCDLQTILVAIDGNNSSRHALEFAIDLATERRAQLIIVHVVPTLELIGTWDEDGGVAFVHQPTDFERAFLDIAAEHAAMRGVSVTTELLGGSPAGEVVTYGEENAVDLIVVGTRGHRPLSSALLGSVSLAVLRNSTRPVAVVRGGVC